MVRVRIPERLFLGLGFRVGLGLELGYWLGLEDRVGLVSELGLWVRIRVVCS